MLLARQLLHAARSGALLPAAHLGAAFALAGDLAAILDAMQAEDIPPGKLAVLDAARFDVYWQHSASALAVIGEHWPALLAARGEADPVAWRNKLLERQRRRLMEAAPAGPVMVVGSTGSLPATAKLIGAVARLKAGAVVLPDLDFSLSDGAWERLSAREPHLCDRAASHPQAQLARLLAAIGARRSMVTELSPPPPAIAMRRALAHLALRPAEETSAWRTAAGSLDIAAAFENVAIAEARDERQEAEVCALAMRVALTETDGDVALVTPDRGLAERVAVELCRWGVTADDSAGRPLSRTSAGALAALLAQALRDGLDSGKAVAILAHERARLGLTPEALAAARAALEIGALRAAPHVATPADLVARAEAMPARAADRRAPLPLKRLSPDEIEAGRDLAARLAATLAPLDAPARPGPLAPAIAAIRAMLADLTREPSGEPAAFDDADGQALSRLIDDLEEALDGLEGTPADAASVLLAAMAEEVVRPRLSLHPRVMILGALEARLVTATLVIMGGLNEGVWPPLTQTDPLLNRPMRAELGLTSPERRIGQSAHDFIEHLSASRVLLTRHMKAAAGAQTIPSRFWQRLQAVVPPDLWREAKGRADYLCSLAARLERPEAYAPRLRPAPKPPAALQPRQFSVTEVETLLRDPYAIHARRILRLDPLQPLGLTLGASDRGQLLHAVMERFGRAFPAALPPDVEREMRRIGEAVFAPVRAEPDVANFWWPRFLGMIPELAAWERQRRLKARRVGVEMRAAAPFRLADGAEITLTGRADRIEELAGAGSPSSTSRPGEFRRPSSARPASPRSCRWRSRWRRARPSRRRA